MDINVKNVDLAYVQCSNLHKLMNDQGSDLLNELKSNINNLKANWISSDASIHINNIIDLHDYLCKLIVSSTDIVSFAASRIIAIQQVRRTNHGGKGAVGYELHAVMFDKYSGGYASETVEYQAASSSLINYLEQLKSIRELFNSLIKEFVSKKDELFNNWIAGANITYAKQVFSDFHDQSAIYLYHLDNAIDNLTKATSNVSQIAN